MRSIKFSIERTVQIHQYEPVKISLEIKEEIESDTSVKQYVKKQYRQLDKLCSNMIEDQIEKYKDR